MLHLGEVPAIAGGGGNSLTLSPRCLNSKCYKMEPFTVVSRPNTISESK